MYPTLLHLGPLTISSYGVCMLLSFIVFVFLIWRRLHDRGVADEVIFDNVIVVTIFGLLGARLHFVVSHWQLFSKSWLWILMIWRFPGLSLWGGLLLGVFALLVYSRLQKLPLALVLDSYGVAIPSAAILMTLGLFLDGTLVGKATTLPWGLLAVGEVGPRHPVALYACISSIVFALGLLAIKKIVGERHIWPTFILWYCTVFIGTTQLVLAFFREDTLYLGGFSVDHILGTILLISPLVPMYVLMQGPAKTKRFFAHVVQKLKRTKRTVSI